MIWGIVKPVWTFEIAPNHEHNCVRISGFYLSSGVHEIAAKSLVAAIASTVSVILWKNNFF